MYTDFENPLKGIAGESLVSHILSHSKECFVRPVSGQTDIGIDLYCELVNSHYHFWVQVKSGKQVKWKKGKEISFSSVPIKSVKYWLKQPIPVFLIGVTDVALNNKNFDDWIWVCDVHEWAQDPKVQRKLKENKNSITIKVKQSHKRIKIGHTDAFFKERVPEAIFRAGASKGIINPVKLGEGSENMVFSGVANHDLVFKAVWNSGFTIANEIAGKYALLKEQWIDIDKKVENKFRVAVELMNQASRANSELKKRPHNDYFNALLFALDEKFRQAVQMQTSAIKKLDLFYAMKGEDWLRIRPTYASKYRQWCKIAGVKVDEKLLAKGTKRKS